MHYTSPSAPVAPVSPGERLATLDALRGVAVFGILLVNMAFFCGPLYAVMMSEPWWTAPADRVAAGVIRTLAEAKFYTLFAFLFGFGMALQQRRVDDRGGGFAALYARRLVVLLMIGLAHALLLWYGDILVVYALLGFVLLLFRKTTGRRLLIWALVIYVIPIVLFTAFTALTELGRLMPNVATEIDKGMAEWEQQARELADRSLAAYGSGTLREILIQRLTDYAYVGFATLAFIVPGALATFLVGRWAALRGVLHDPPAHSRFWRWLGTWGLGLGLLSNLGYTLLLERGGVTHANWTTLTAHVLHWVGTPLLSGGYAALIVGLMQSAAWRRRLAPVTAVGRMALSNYLFQTVVCTTLFYSYGLGLFGKIGPAIGVAVTIVIYAMQLPLSTWWLRRFRFGPMEWLWRSATYRRWQPLRTATVAAASLERPA